MNLDRFVHLWDASSGFITHFIVSVKQAWLTLFSSFMIWGSIAYPKKWKKKWTKVVTFIIVGKSICHFKGPLLTLMHYLPWSEFCAAWGYWNPWGPLIVVFSEAILNKFLDNKEFVWVLLNLFWTCFVIL